MLQLIANTFAIKNYEKLLENYEQLRPGNARNYQTLNMNPFFKSLIIKLYSYLGKERQVDLIKCINKLTPQQYDAMILRQKLFCDKMHLKWK